MLKNKNEKKKKNLAKKSISLLSALQALHLWFGNPSEFQALLVQGSAQAAEWSSVHSQYIAGGGSPVYETQWCNVDYRDYSRILSSLRWFYRVQNFCLFAKMVHGILFWSLIFLKLQFQFPFWKALSNYGFDGHKDVYEYFRGKLLAMVRTLAKTLCFTQLRVFLRPSTVFFFPYRSLLSLPFRHSLHCDCSANARLKKMSFLFYCIILPFD